MTFLDFARAHGVLINPVKLYPSERIHRCGTVDKPRSTNGAFYWNGERGWVWRWDMEAEAIWFEDKNAKPWTEEQKKDWIKKRREADRAKETEYDKVARKAAEFLSTLKTGTHDYFIRKGLPTVTGLVKDKDLYVPMRNCKTKKVQGYQRIFFEDGKWHKKMLYGMLAKNAVLEIGQGRKVYLCEGVATGYSIKECVPDAKVVICFSAQNMIQVAQQIGDYVCADNDVSQTGMKAAIETGLPWVMPEQVGWDFNDLHQHSKFAAQQKLGELLQKR